MTQTAADTGDSTSQDISAEWPLCQPGPHKYHSAGDTAGLSPTPFPCRYSPFVSTTSQQHPAQSPVVCAARLKHEVTESDSQHSRDGGELFSFPAAVTQPHAWGGGSEQKAAGGREEKHRGRTELLVPRVWDGKVAAGSQLGDMWLCPTAALQGAGHPSCPALPGLDPQDPPLADELVSQLDVHGGTGHCSLFVTKVGGWVTS